MNEQGAKVGPSAVSDEMIASIKSREGVEVLCSDWLQVGEQMIRDFAGATKDQQWIHVDRARCETDSPIGVPIAHGYLLLSLYPFLRGLCEEEAPAYPGFSMVLNYGANRLRFPSSVAVGQRIRARVTLSSARAVGGMIEVTEHFTVEVEGGDKPACVADLVMRLVP